MVKTTNGYDNHSVGVIRVVDFHTLDMYNIYQSIYQLRRFHPIRSIEIRVFRTNHTDTKAPEARADSMKNIQDGGKAAKLLEVAFQLFLEHGYEATGIRTICNSADTELAMLYYHFGSKKGLFLALAHDLRKDYDAEFAKRRISENLADYLRDHFLFAMHYTMEHLPQTRFFLRYSLFPPQELKEEITAFLEANTKTRNELLLPYVEACVLHGLIGIPVDQALRTYLKFMNNNTFDVVFSGWTPDDGELMHLWQVFERCRLCRDPNTL